MMPASKRHSRHERDYIERTIATVRNHRDADNCWPQWANIFADEIEGLYEQLETIRKALDGAWLCPVHGIPDCSPLLNGCPRVNQITDWIAAHDGLASTPAKRDEA